MSIPAWAEALVQAGLYDAVTLEAVIEVMQKAGIAEATDDNIEDENGRRTILSF